MVGYRSFLIYLRFLIDLLHVCLSIFFIIIVVDGVSFGIRTQALVLVIALVLVLRLPWIVPVRGWNRV